MTWISSAATARCSFGSFSFLPFIFALSAAFCFFFSETPVTNFEQAVATEAERFKALFRHALDNGVYLPPSPYETCFLSAAHGDEEIDRTLEILAKGIRKL